MYLLFIIYFSFNGRLSLLLVILFSYGWLSHLCLFIYLTIYFFYFYMAGFAT
ncbi:hypothetical protein ACMBCN_01945 [Candidatus Liberibacter asiaticus]|nr:hypothetical protein [Candidatus Liberibacter asiaticus]